MEIKNLNVGSYRTQRDDSPLRTHDTGAQRTGPVTSAAGLAGQDRVSVSQDALLRTEAYKTAATASDIRQEKVNSIKERVASGNYTINSRNIASKLLQSEMSLFRS